MLLPPRCPLRRQRGRRRGFPTLDLRLVQLVVEQAAEHAEYVEDTPETVLIDRIGLLESLQHSLAACRPP